MSSRKRSKEQMISSKKLKKQSSSDSDSSDEEMEVSEVQVDFSGFELAPEDSNGIQLLLQRLFLKLHVDLAELTNYLLYEQLDVGSVIKESEIDSEDESNEDDIVYGVISVVSLSREEKFKFIAQLKTLLSELSKQHATEQTKTFLSSVLNDSSNQVGFIINERYTNLPPAVSVPLFKKLTGEIETESKKSPHFNFTHYVMICKLYKIPSATKKKKQSNHHFEEIWCNAEEEIFDKKADARFEFAVTEESDSGLSGSWTENDEEMLPFRRVLIFTAPKLEEIMDALSVFS